MLNRIRQTDESVETFHTGRYVLATSPFRTRDYGPYSGLLRNQKYVWDYHENTPWNPKHFMDGPRPVILGAVRLNEFKIVSRKTEAQNWVGGNKVASGGYYYTVAGANPLLSIHPYRQVSTGDICIDPLVFDSVPGEWATYLWQRALSKMNSAQVDIGMPVGELAETAAMLAKPVQGIVTLSQKAFKGVSHIFRDGPRVAVRLSKRNTAKQLRRMGAYLRRHPTRAGLHLVDESANHWLEYKFGILPFIKSAGEILDFAHENLAYITDVTCSRSKSGRIETNFAWRRTGISTGLMSVDALDTRYYSTEYTCGLYWKWLDTDPFMQFCTGIGVSPWQVPSLSYELIPLSFVVDRFIDIKSFVRGNLHNPSQSVLGAYVSKKMVCVAATSCYNAYVLDSAKNQMFGKLGYPDQVPQVTTTVQSLARIINPERPLFPVINPRWAEELRADVTNLSLIWGRLRKYVGKL